MAAKPTIAQELEAACLERDQIKGERDASLVKIAELSEAFKVLESRADEQAKKDQETATKLADVLNELAVVTAARDSLASELESVKAAAALNPVPDVAGVSPVDAAPVAAEVADVSEQFAAITNPAERTAFYRKHSAELWRPKQK
jgi:hypothetical protein